jgi:chaperonin GroEL (HSP60 family)
MRQAQHADERAAYHILLQAIEVPMRTLLSNAGYAPEDVLAQIVPHGLDYGFDVTRGQVVEVKHSGIVDLSSAVKAAVSKAIHGTVLALTIDVLVHPSNPSVEIKP